MKNLSISLLTLLCLGWGSSIAQSDDNTSEKPAIKKEVLNAVKITSKPKIDGILDDEVYKQAAPRTTNFYQISPNNGEPAAYETKVMVLYTDFGLYIAAQMYDPDPATIPQELGKRDDLNKNVDLLAVIFDPVNKGQNGFNYVVTAAGVQGDAVMSSNDEDWNWDAVWKSEVKINEEGWAMEMEIPYSAIRFPKHESGDWGINFFRQSQRLNEESTFNFVDQEESGFINQVGTLTGLENISPPLRLSFSPYVSAAVSHDGEADAFGTSYAGGMDLKLGLSESFTLDMSLIPDFSQVQSDDQVLNLSPFEIQFDENRPFFTEGVELFSKGNIFYSRRVGQSRGEVDEDDLASNEEIRNSPIVAPLLNATKISGRTAKGTGIGFFNAISRETYATIENTETGEIREYAIDPLTNYNVLVVDQNLKNNSNFSVINTNVMREGEGKDANVTVGQVMLRDKSNTWSVFADGGYSHIVTQGEDGEEIKSGFRNTLSFAKVSGKFNFTTGFSQESDTWDINDLGYLRAPNEFRVFGRMNYNIYKPFGVFNRMNTWFRFNHEQLYSPRTFTQFRINSGAWFQFKNFFEAGGGFNLNPVTSYNYYEPRVEGRYFTNDPNGNFFLFAETDTRKAFSVEGEVGTWMRPATNSLYIFSSIEPSYRVNNKLNISYSLELENGTNGRGYVTETYDVNDELEDIIFGNRSEVTAENVLGINYTFNNKMALTFRLRHYLSWAEYDKFYALEDDGTLGDTDFDGFNPDGTSDYNSSFNAFNIDMVYSWQIAPGSFITVNWKDAIYQSDDTVERSFGKNFTGTLKDNHFNTLSIKFIYFIDISYFKRLGNKDA